MQSCHRGDITLSYSHIPRIKIYLLMAKRDTYKYELTKGNRVVYVGITNDPHRREAEHRQDKDIDKMRIVGNASTLDGASQWGNQ